jgi:hypothetical protein
VILQNKVSLKSIFLSLVLCSLIRQPAISQSEASVKMPPIQSTFIQLTNTQGDWDTYDWEELFSYFHKLRLTQVIVQWTVYDQTDFYLSGKPNQVPNPPIETILRLADDAGIKVLIGLVHDSDYWAKIQQELVMVNSYFDGLSDRCLEVAKALTPVVEKHPSFQGWYITQEIDDINWQRPKPKATLFKFLSRLSENLHQLYPGGVVAVSGFSNAATDPEAFEDFWSALLKKTNIDIVLFQDGIGANKLEIDEVPFYLAAMEKATKANSRSLQAVIEIFTQTNGEPIDEGEFRAEPASLFRINQQIKIALNHTANITAFSIPDYMSPLGGPLAGQLYDKYLKEINSEREEK